MEYVDMRLGARALMPRPHLVLYHHPPRQVNRGGIPLLVWSEATVLMY